MTTEPQIEGDFRKRKLSIMQLFLKAEGVISHIGLIFAGFALVASIVMVVIGVIGRYVLHIAVIFVDEYTGYALVVMSFMALANALTAEKHIKIDTVIRFMPPILRNWLSVITSIVGFGIAVFITIQTWERAIMSFHNGIFSVSPLETPLFIPQLFIPIGFIMLDITLIVYICRKIEYALKYFTDTKKKQ